MRIASSTLLAPSSRPGRRWQCQSFMAGDPLEEEGRRNRPLIGAVVGIPLAGILSGRSASNQSQSGTRKGRPYSVEDLT
jgi:hypothetical protein